MSQRTKRNRKQQQQPEEKEEEENGASGTNGHDEDAASSSTTTFKIPSASSKTAIINDDDDNKSEQIITEEIVDCIKTDDDDIVTTIESDRVITTRSRSNTPQIKVVRNESIDSNNIDETVTITEQEVLLVKENGATAASSSQPLLATVVDDEADPELLFDDDDNNSDDFLLGKASPIVMMTRCKTRRSQISRTTSPETPKTPKKSPVLVSEEKVTVNNDPNTNIIVEAEEKEENDEGKDALNATTSNNNDNDNKRRGVDISDDDDDDILLSDISTKVHVGGDATNISCLDSFINTTRNNTTSGSLKIKTKVDNNKSSVIIDDDDDDKESSFLHTSKKRTMGETLRGLTSRRTIRPIHANYYNNKSIIFNKHNKDGRSFTSSSNNDSKNNILLLDYPSRQNSIDRISLSSKRKRCSESVENLKRFKSDSVRSSSTAGGGGLLSIFTSPLMTNVRNRFYSNLVASSTPKLTGYKDDVLVVGDDVRSHGNDDERKEEIYERKWCAIM